jgi:hypothetical protein
MDEKDNDKKRVLTPPSEWADGLKPKSSTQSGEDAEIDESTDWLEDDDFEVPPSSEPSANVEPSANEEPSTQEASGGATGRSADVHSASSADAILTDHGEAQAGSALQSWLQITLGSGRSRLCYRRRHGRTLARTHKAQLQQEIAELKDTIRSLKRSENQPVFARQRLNS